ERLLRVVAGLGAVAEPDLAGGGLAAAEQRLEQGRLARAVRPDQGDPLPALDGEVGALDERAPGDGHVEPLRLDDDPAAALRRRKAEAERALRRRPVDALDPGHRLQLALGLARLRPVAEAVDEALQVGQLLLLALEGAGLGRQPLGLQPAPVRVAALVEAALAAV